MTKEEKIQELLAEGWIQQRIGVRDLWLSPDDTDKDDLMTFKSAWSSHRSLQRSGGFFDICDVCRVVERVYRCSCGGKYCDQFMDSDDHGCDDIAKDNRE
jgi:hypothetical protein